MWDTIVQQLGDSLFSLCIRRALEPDKMLISGTQTSDGQPKRTQL